MDDVGEQKAFANTKTIKSNNTKNDRAGKLQIMASTMLVVIIQFSGNSISLLLTLRAIWFSFAVYVLYCA